MQDHVQKLDQGTVDLIERTVREWMSAYAIRAVSARLGSDHDGDPVIRVEVHYDLTDVPIDTEISSRLGSVLRERLWAQGVSLFPHVRQVFDERQPIKPMRRRKA